MRGLADISPLDGEASLMVAWRVAGRRSLVVGGGPVAVGRVRLLLDAGSSVTVVAVSISAELRGRAARGEIDVLRREFQASDLEGRDMVLVAIDDAAVSAGIAVAARARRIPVNVADDPQWCDFWFPAVHRDGPLQVAVSSGGAGPALAARLRDEIVRALPAAAADALRPFGALRRSVRARAPGPLLSGRRMAWLGELSRRWSWSRLAALDEDGISALVERFARGEPVPRHGRISLVGAGPGDPGLLTVVARERLEQAELVVADRLVPPAILALVTGELRVADKEAGRADTGQGEIHAWLIEAARRGQAVVRLKIGDPFLFGRGGEEIEALAAAGFEAEVIPGLSSALAAPVLGGIPTTLRGVADRVVVLTGQGRGGQVIEAPAWHPTTTFVFLMGVARARSLVVDLLAQGFPPDLPVAVVERASWPDQRVLRTQLAELPELARLEQVRAPAALIIGAVAGWAASRAEPGARAEVRLAARA